MKLDLDRLTQILNNTASDIKSAAEKASVNPMEAMKFVPQIMDNLHKLQSYGQLEGINASDKSKVNSVYEAINLFLKNTKDAQEKVGAMGAAIFNNPSVREVTANLNQIKEQLDAARGGRVTPKDNEGL